MAKSILLPTYKRKIRIAHLNTSNDCKELYQLNLEIGKGVKEEFKSTHPSGSYIKEL